MRTPFYKKRADSASQYRRDGDFVRIREVLPDDNLGPSYVVSRDGSNQQIYGVRGPKSPRFAVGNTAFLRYLGGSHYYAQLEGVSGGYGTVSVLSSGTGDISDPDMDNYVLRTGDVLSGTLEGDDKVIEVDFIDGLLTFHQTAGVFEQDNDLILSSQAAGQWSLEQLVASSGLLHHESHEDGGVDEVNVAGLSGLLADPQTPLTHHLTHENGGADEISVTGLSGELADPQTPKTHAASHQEGGSDEISIEGLAGEASQAQKTTVRKNNGTNVGSRSRLHLSEGANIAISVSDNETDDEIIIEIAAAGSGWTHHTSHENGGADEISVAGLAGELADPQKLAVRKNWEENVGVRPRLHLSEGDNITLSLFDNPDDDEIILMIAASGCNWNHHTTHEYGGDDEIDVTDLIGELAYPQKVTIRQDSGENIGSRPRLNFVAGSNISLSVADDGEDDEVILTLAATGGTGSPGGSDGQVQYNDGGALGGSTAITYDDSTGETLITSQADTSVPLTIKGAESQSASLQEWQDSSTNTIASLKIAGDFTGGNFYLCKTGLSNIAHIGYGQTSDNFAYLDLISDTTYTGAPGIYPGLRIIRGPGANQYSRIYHSGTGTFSIICNQAADLEFKTNNTTRLTISSAGIFTAPDIYDNSLSGRDLYIDSSGHIGYYSSSLKYKDNIRALFDARWIYSLRPVVFDRKDGSAINEMGLIAEEVAEIEPRLVAFDKQGLPDGVEYKSLITPLLVELQNLHREVSLLQEEVEKIRGPH